MNRLFAVCALFGLFALGCSTAPAPATKSADKSAATPSPAATAAATPTAQPTRPADEKGGANAEGDVTGAYFPVGALPAEFSEIEHLSLATIDDTGNPAPLNGFIRPKRRSAKDYRLVSPRLNGRELSFTTEAVGGVSYSFKGTFQKLGDFASDPPPTDEVILKGRLTKLLDGKTAAEADVNFTYSAGG